MRKQVALCLAVVMMVVAFAGCGKEKKETATATIGELKYSDTYPIKSDTELTYNVRLDSILAGEVSNMGETEWAKELEKKTGIKVKYQHPTVGQEHETFNLMIASGEYPDIFETNWYNNPSGPSGAFKDNIILPLNDIIAKASPNMQKLLNEDAMLSKEISVNGDIYCYPSIGSRNVASTYYGVMARKDLLDKIGMDVPETIDEWEAVLTALKKEVKYPLYIRLEPVFLSVSNVLVGAYGVGACFYVEDGVVKYGPQEEGFRKWVEKMADWYKKGLINTDFANPDSTVISSNFVNGDIGMTIGSNGSDFGTWLPVLRENVKGAELVPVPYPVLNKGDYPQFGQKSVRVSGYGASISTQCKDVELAARLLDYAYTKEGTYLYQIGIEGKTYEMKDGKPEYLPIVYDEKVRNGKSMSQILSIHSRATTGGPYMSDDDATRMHLKHYYSEPAQLAAAELWAKNDGDKHELPNLITTDEETDRISALRGDLYTFVDEYVVNLINGVEPLSNYDEFLDGIKKMGVDEILKIYQRAYDDYMKD